MAVPLNLKGYDEGVFIKSKQVVIKHEIDSVEHSFLQELKEPQNYNTHLEYSAGKQDEKISNMR